MGGPVFKKGLFSIFFAAALSFADAAELPTISVFANTGAVKEAGSGQFLIAKNLSQDVVVHFEVVGSATPVLDFRLFPSSNSVTIPSYTNSISISLRALDDVEIEPEETVIVRLVADPAYLIGDASLATIRILDKPPALPTVHLDAPLLTGVWSAETLKATAHGDIVAAWIYDGSQLIAQPSIHRYETVTLFEWPWTPESAGLHQLTAIVKDSRAFSATSTVPALVADTIRLPNSKGNTPDGQTLVPGYVVTRMTSESRGFGLAEFPVPLLKDCTAILKFSSETTLAHDLYIYAGDGLITEADLTTDGDFVARFNQSPRSGTNFEVDVTPFMKRFAGKQVGFQLKIADGQEPPNIVFADQLFNNLQLVDISRTNDVPPRARWINPTATRVAFEGEPFEMRFSVVDVDSRITRLRLMGDDVLATVVTDLPPGTNLVSVMWTNPVAQSNALSLVMETDTGVIGKNKFLPITVVEGHHGEPAHRWVARAQWGDSFFIVGADGRAWAFGDNASGELGLGSEDNVVFPARLLAAPPGHKWRQFAAGNSIGAGLTDKGALFMSGIQSRLPVEIPFPDGVYYWRQIDVAGALWLLDQSGRVWSWTSWEGFRRKSDTGMTRIQSYNEAFSVLAQRNDGTLVTVPGETDPVLIPLGASQWLDVSASGHAAAIAADRQLYAWVRPSTATFPRRWEWPVYPIFYQPSRVLVSGVSGWSRVAVNSYATIALALDGKIYSWGDGYGSSQPKFGDAYEVELPDIEREWLDIGVGNSFAVAVSATGNAYIWGRLPQGLFMPWREVRVPERIEIPGLFGNNLRVVGIANNNVTAEVVGPAGVDVTIERSSDLQTWTGGTTVANPTGKVTVTQEIQSAVALFIRAR